MGDRQDDDISALDVLQNDGGKKLQLSAVKIKVTYSCQILNVKFFRRITNLFLRTLKVPAADARLCRVSEKRQRHHGQGQRQHTRDDLPRVIGAEESVRVENTREHFRGVPVHFGSNARDKVNRTVIRPQLLRRFRRPCQNPRRRWTCTSEWPDNKRRNELGMLEAEVKRSRRGPRRSRSDDHGLIRALFGLRLAVLLRRRVHSVAFCETRNEKLTALDHTMVNSPFIRGDAYRAAEDT